MPEVETASIALEEEETLQDPGAERAWDEETDHGAAEEWQRFETREELDESAATETFDDWFGPDDRHFITLSGHLGPSELDGFEVELYVNGEPLSRTLDEVGLAFYREAFLPQLLATGRASFRGAMENGEVLDGSQTVLQGTEATVTFGMRVRAEERWVDDELFLPSVEEPARVDPADPGLTMPPERFQELSLDDALAGIRIASGETAVRSEPQAVLETAAWEMPERSIDIPAPHMEPERQITPERAAAEPFVRDVRERPPPHERFADEVVAHAADAVARAPSLPDAREKIDDAIAAEALPEYQSPPVGDIRLEGAHHPDHPERGDREMQDVAVDRVPTADRPHNGLVRLDATPATSEKVQGVAPERERDSVPAVMPAHAERIALEPRTVPQIPELPEPALPARQEASLESPAEDAGTDATVLATPATTEGWAPPATSSAQPVHAEHPTTETARQEPDVHAERTLPDAIVPPRGARQKDVQSDGGAPVPATREEAPDVASETPRPTHLRVGRAEERARASRAPASAPPFSVPANAPLNPPAVDRTGATR